MKTTLLPFLGLFTTALSAHADAPGCPSAPAAHSPNVWETVAYPDFCSLNASLGTSFGLSSYSINSSPTAFRHLIDISIGAFSLGFSQVLGYSHWFYIELRENLSYGNTFYGVQDDGAVYPRRLHSAWFFDADARFFVPFRASCSNRLSLQPFAGFAIHQAHLKGSLLPTNGTNYGTLLHQRYLAPLAGLALGYNPTPAFALRSSLSIQIPHGKQAQPMQPAAGAHDYTTLRIQRHGIGMDLLALAKLSPNWTLRGEIDYFSYSAYSNSTVTWETNATSCLSLKFGTFYQF